MATYVIYNVQPDRNRIGVVTGLQTSTTRVAEMSDVNDCEYLLNNKIQHTTDKIIAEQNQRKKEDEKLKSSIEQLEYVLGEKVDREQVGESLAQLLDNDRLVKEKAALEELFNGFLVIVQQQCSKEKNEIAREVEAFKKIDLNEELIKNLKPTHDLIQQLGNKSDAISDKLAKIAPLHVSIKELNSQIDHLKEDMEKFETSKNGAIVLMDRMSDKQESIQEVIKDSEASVKNLTERLKEYKAIYPVFEQHQILVQRFEGIVKKGGGVLINLEAAQSDAISLLESLRQIILKKEKQEKDMKAEIEKLQQEMHSYMQERSYKMEEQEKEMKREIEELRQEMQSYIQEQSQKRGFWTKIVEKVGLGDRFGS